jgi:Domain of unknown function (DUF397)
MSAKDLAWFKSSYSGNEGGECVEVAIAWRKSSHSTNEVAACPGAVHVRDSKTPTAPHLTLPPTAWTAFLTNR